MDQEAPGMSLGEIARILYRYAWMIVVGGAAGGVLAWYLTSPGPPVYEARTTILIQQGANSIDVTSGDIATSEKLATTYERLITTRPILERAVRDIGSEEVSVGELGSAIRVEAISGTQLLTVSARSEDPERAALLANATAAAFIDDNTETRLAEVVRAQQAAAAQGITDLSGFVAQQLSGLQTLRVVEAAKAPGGPLGSGRNAEIITGVFLGLLTGIGIALALNYFSDPIPSPERLEETLGIPTLAIVDEWQRQEVDEYQLAFSPSAKSKYTEEYRGLAANVAFAAAPVNAKVLLVTSSVPNEGKTRTTANLALAFAERGEQVAVVDADLRKPQLNRLLSTDEPEKDNLGLSMFLSEREDNSEDPEIRPIKLSGYRSRPGISILPSGPLPPNPTSLLSSERMGMMLESLRLDHSMVIMDSPPVLAVADSAAIAPHADGIVFVLDPTTTRFGQLKAAIRATQRTGCPILGLVMNKIPARHKSYGYYGGYYYGQYYYEGHDSPNGSSNGVGPRWLHRPANAARRVRNVVSRRS